MSDPLFGDVLAQGHADHRADLGLGLVADAFLDVVAFLVAQVPGVHGAIQPLGGELRHAADGVVLVEVLGHGVVHRVLDVLQNQPLGVAALEHAAGRRP